MVRSGQHLIGLIRVRGKEPRRVFLTWVVLIPGDLLEAVVEGQVVTDGVLPPGLVAAVEGKIVGDVLVDLAQRHPLLRHALYCHGDESRVGVWRADQTEHVFWAGHGEPRAAVEIRQESGQSWKRSCRQTSVNARDRTQGRAAEVVSLGGGRQEPLGHLLDGVRRSWGAVQAEVTGIEAQSWKLQLGERLSTKRRRETLLGDEGRHLHLLCFSFLAVVLLSCTCTALYTCCCSPDYLYAAVRPTDVLIGYGGVSLSHTLWH